MLAFVKRTSVRLPDQLDTRLRLEAKRRGITISELTREAIEARLDQPRRRRPRPAHTAAFELIP